jgi:hypothetical protein
VAIAALTVVAASCGSTTGSVDQVRRNVKRVQSMLGSSNLAVPAIVFEVRPDGTVDKVGGFSADFVDDVFEARFGYPLIGKLVKFDPELVERLDRAGIQQVTVASRPEGLFFLVNGQPLPHLAWDAEAFDNLEALASMVVEPTDPALADDMYSLLSEDGYEQARWWLEALRTINMRFDIKFPQTRGGPKRVELPLAGDEAFEAALTTEEIDEEPLQTVDLIVDYKPLVDEQGRTAAWVPSVFGLTTVELQALAEPFDTEVPVLRMRDDVRMRLEHEGIVGVGLEARKDGLFVSVNDRLLPHVAWNETTLVNLSDFLVRMFPEGLEDDGGGAESEDAVDWLEVLQMSAPMYNDYAIAVLLRFPVDAPAVD